MNHDSDQPSELSAFPPKPKPADLKEFSLRAILCGLFVAGLMGASYPYVVLKLGFGPNVSVVAAILGYIVLGLLGGGLVRILGIRYRSYNRWENNIVQTAGTAAAQTAFMCVLLAAFDMLRENHKEVGFTMVLRPIDSFAWLTAAGLLGVLLAVPLRRHYIVDEKLPFADGLAAGQTILVCDSEGPTAKQAALAMIAGMIASALLMGLSEDGHILKHSYPTQIVFGRHLEIPTALVEDWAWLTVPARMLALSATTRVGIEWSLLALGSGMIIGMRININMLIGTTLSWFVAPYFLSQAGILKENFTRNDVLFWVMWPATGMLVAGGLAALILRWRVLAKTFKNLAVTSSASEEFPLRWVIIGAIVSGAALVTVQYFMLGQPPWITIVAILLSVPLALVGLRVLGETNWGPISALSNMMQGVFALLAPGNVPANMVASGTTGTVAIESEAIMQDYKAGHMVGSSPRFMTYMQLLATPLGAAAVAWMYPVLHDTYGFREDGLSSPISQKWAGFAAILAKGADALPQGAGYALIVGAILGIAFAIVEGKVKDKTWVPSATGLGIGMLVPAATILTMFLGALIGFVWSRTHSRSSDLCQIPLASGLIAGEALVAVLVPALIAMRVLEA
jgi:uncharacterized oligopeptide transporter (OPT) family protein